jgi:hypothetical protein
MLSAIPLLSIVLLLANAVAFGAQAGFAEAMFSITLPSGGVVAFTTGDGLILLGLGLLYAEIFKATRTSSLSVIDHALSLIVFIVMLVELLIGPKFAHAAFFALTAMSLIDVIAGFTVTIASARRDFAPVNPG